MLNNYLYGAYIDFNGENMSVLPSDIKWRISTGLPLKLVDKYLSTPLMSEIK